MEGSAATTRWVAGAVVATMALAAAGLASAKGPEPVDRGYPPPGVTVTGIGRADVDARDRDGEAAIRRAVSAATDEAVPRALRDARHRARVLADAAGMRLGAVWAVERDPNLPWPGAGIEQGTFSNGRYCGTIRRAVGWRTNDDGRRVRRFARRHGCRAPSDVAVYLTVTIAQL